MVVAVVMLTGSSLYSSASNHVVLFYLFYLFIFLHFVVGCGTGSTALSCSGDLCESASCEAHDNSVCEVDSCSNCTVKHYVGVEEVTDQCGIYRVYTIIFTNYFIYKLFLLII